MNENKKLYIFNTKTTTKISRDVEEEEKIYIKEKTTILFFENKNIAWGHKWSSSVHVRLKSYASIY